MTTNASQVVSHMQVHKLVRFTTRLLVETVGRDTVILRREHGVGGSMGMDVLRVVSAARSNWLLGEIFRSATVRACEWISRN